MSERKQEHTLAHTHEQQQQLILIAVEMWEKSSTGNH